MGFLIDTDWIIPYGDNTPDAAALLEQLASDGLAISVISYMETYQGLWRSPQPDLARVRFEALVNVVEILPVTVPIARCCAVLRETLRQQGRRVHPRALDLLIAATAIEHNLVLVTRNTNDNRDVPGLALFEA